MACSGMRQSRPKCKILGQARRPAPTKACRGDSLWSPGSMKFDFDSVLMACCPGIDFLFFFSYDQLYLTYPGGYPIIAGFKTLFQG